MKFKYFSTGGLITVIFLITLLLPKYYIAQGERRRNPASWGRQTYQQHQSQSQATAKPPNQHIQRSSSESNEGDIQQVSRNSDEHIEFQKLINIQRPDSEPEAVTPKGTFVGLKELHNGREVYAFYGIPYAKPPVRFQRPEMAEKIEGLKKSANEKPPACSQSILGTTFPGFDGEEMWNPNTNLSENCLFLNIWVPKTVFDNADSTSKVPVFFWIFGGGFFSGSSSLDVYDGGLLAATQNLIFVSPMYRLGPLGFLYLGIDDAPGNMGLLDQALALQWTKENIAYFGGDPLLITAAGESAGSASVGYHLLSPISKSWIRRGIMMSGIPGPTWSFVPSELMKERSLQLAYSAGCQQKDLKEIAKCLRNVEVDKLNALQWKHYQHMMEFQFAPTIDNHFIKEDPYSALKRGKGSRAELLTGTVEDEGTYFLLYHFVNQLSHKEAVPISYDRFVEMANEILYRFTEKEKEAIITEYTNWINPEDGLENLKNIGDLIGHMIFSCPQRNWADDWANRGLPVFYYHFTERLSSNPWGKWMGVMHGDDVPLLFGAALKNDSFTPEEKQMTANFMKMVGDFVKTGVPSSKWERYTSEYPVYLDINAKRISNATTEDSFGPKANECAFWNKILPLISNSCPGPVATASAYPQSPTMRNSPLPYPSDRPQWNSNGQGIQGGQGFYCDNLNHYNCPGYQHQMGHCPYPNYNPNQWNCNTQPAYQSHHQCQQQEVQKTSTETSCRCTVEEGSTEREIPQSGFGRGTPPPAIV